MISVIKHTIKKTLASLGFLNPALGAKIGGEAKASLLLEHKAPGMSVFVETGTNRGNMIALLSRHFQKTYSIEYDKALYENACERFRDRADVVLIHGDSGIEIQRVLTELHEPALFWLDAHGDRVPVSGPHAAPIEKELEAIFNHHVKGHVILIDDVRHFDLEGVGLVKRIALKNGYSCVVRDGIFILRQQ